MAANLEDQNIPAEKRRATRYPIEAPVAVRKRNGEVVRATSVNVSASGILLHVEHPARFHLGEEVSIQFDSEHDADKPLSTWGVGRVVRVDQVRSAVQLDAGTFHHLPSDGGECADDG